MKKYLGLLLLVTCFTGNQLWAQKQINQDTLIVKGICEMCKKRIEDAAYGKGVKFASWEKVSDQLVVIYRADKTSLEAIEDRIVLAGHSTENREAGEDDYNKLPACCRYEELHDH